MLRHVAFRPGITRHCDQPTSIEFQTLPYIARSVSSDLQESEKRQTNLIRLDLETSLVIDTVIVPSDLRHESGHNTIERDSIVVSCTIVTRSARDVERRGGNGGRTFEAELDKVAHSFGSFAFPQFDQDISQGGLEDDEARSDRFSDSGEMKPNKSSNTPSNREVKAQRDS